MMNHLKGNSINTPSAYLLLCNFLSAAVNMSWSWKLLLFWASYQPEPLSAMCSTTGRLEWLTLCKNSSTETVSDWHLARPIFKSLNPKNKPSFILFWAVPVIKTTQSSSREKLSQSFTSFGAIPEKKAENNNITVCQSFHILQLFDPKQFRLKIQTWEDNKTVWVGSKSSFRRKSLDIWKKEISFN